MAFSPLPSARAMLAASSIYIPCAILLSLTILPLIRSIYSSKSSQPSHKPPTNHHDNAMAAKAPAAGPATTAIPAFVSAMGPEGKSVVFYIDEYGFIKRWEQQDDNEAHPQDGRNEYNDVAVRTADKKSIKTTSRDLGLAVFERHNQCQIRLYFANEQNILNELCLDVDPKSYQPVGRSAGTKAGVWFEGGLNSNNFKAKAGTPVSAHHIAGSNSALKVYFFSGEEKAKDDNRPTVAWIETGEKASKWNNLVVEI